jgi:hypothetical protein
MPLTLWRGDQLLGTIHLRASSTPRRIDGVLLPADSGARLTSVWQSHLFIPGHVDAVLQTPLEPDIVEERRKRPLIGDSGPMALQRLEPGESLGVPPSEQLQVRGRGDGEPRIVSITLQEHRPIPTHPDPELATFPSAAVVSGSVWLIWAATDKRPAT